MDDSAQNPRTPNADELIKPETPTESMEEAVQRLATVTPMAYDQCRQAEAKRLGVRIATLDQEVRNARPASTDNEQGRTLTLEPPDPWPDAVDGVAVLDEVQAMLARFVVADSPTLHAATIWAAFTHFIDSVKVAPIANITAPEKNCGKSTLLGCFARLTQCPMKTDSISPAAIFRIMDMYRPTLLIDEVDAFLKDNESARNILNSGHEPNGHVIRVVGDGHEPRQFRTFGAKALCGIGSIQSTLQSRSIRLELRRKLPKEQAENLKFSDALEWQTLQRKLARLATDHSATVRKAGPCSLSGLSNRAGDNWQPLIAIADAVGGHWTKTIRAAAWQLESLETESPEIGCELLADVQAVFDDRRVSRIRSRDLLYALLNDDESPWPTWNRGKPLSARQLARMLKPYGGVSRDLRIGTSVQKGYKREDLDESFTRYLTATPDISATPLQSPYDAACSDIESATPLDLVADKESPEPLRPNACSSVADKNTPQGQRDDVEVF